LDWMSSAGPGARRPGRAAATRRAAFSSGSTGRTRGVDALAPLTSSPTPESIVQADRLGEGDRVMAVLPFHYSFGASVLQTHLACGGTVVNRQALSCSRTGVQRMSRRAAPASRCAEHYQILLRKSRFKEFELPDLKWLHRRRKLQAPSCASCARRSRGAPVRHVPPRKRRPGSRSCLVRSGRSSGSVGKGIPASRCVCSTSEASRRLRTGR